MIAEVIPFRPQPKQPTPRAVLLRNIAAAWVQARDAAATRRGVLGGASLAGLIGIAAAGRVPPTDPHPDARLIKLGAELTRAVALEKQAEAIAEHEHTQASEDLVEAAWKRSADIVDQIEALSAATLEGFAVKRQAIDWCWCGDPVTAAELADHPHPSTDMRLIASILQDLAALAEAASNRSASVGYQEG